MLQSVLVYMTSRAKKRYVSAISDVSGSTAER